MSKTGRSIIYYYLPQLPLSVGKKAVEPNTTESVRLEVFAQSDLFGGSDIIRIFNYPFTNISSLINIPVNCEIVIILLHQIMQKFGLGKRYQDSTWTYYRNSPHVPTWSSGNNPSSKQVKINRSLTSDRKNRSVLL